MPTVECGMNDSLITQKRHDGTLLIWVGDETGECSAGMKACAILDVYPRSERYHCGCKDPLSSKRRVRSETMMMGLERILDGKGSIEDLPSTDYSMESLYGKPPLMDRLLGR